VLALAGWWGHYFWRHTPARHAYRRATAASHATAVLGGPLFTFDPLFAALRLALGDLVCGASTVVLLAIGTRVYTRRLQIWLDARTSGEAVSFGGTELESQALSANADPKVAPSPRAADRWRDRCGRRTQRPDRRHTRRRRRWLRRQPRARQERQRRRPTRLFGPLTPLGVSHAELELLPGSCDSLPRDLGILRVHLPSEEPTAETYCCHPRRP
jgi:hypothetical protein